MLSIRKYPYFFSKFCQFIILVFALSLSACATQYVVDTDPDQLVAAMQDLPEVQHYLANINYYPVLNNASGTSTANSADSRNIKDIVYSEDEMLNQAGHASIFRWFTTDGKNEELVIPKLNIHARIFQLDHSLQVEGGRMRPIAKTKLEVYVTDADENRVYESYFTAEAQGDLIKPFRNKRETQDMYGFTIYKSLALAFDSAFTDITENLNLMPSNFDVDELEIELKDQENLEITENQISN